MPHPPAGKIRTTTTIFATLGILSAMGTAASAAVTFVGSSTFNGTGISASATFSTDGRGDLFVTLVNTYTGGTPDQSHILTALFFSGANGLTPVANSAVAPSGSKEWNDGNQFTPADNGYLPGQQWEYLSGLSAIPGGATAGISSTGLGIFGTGNFAANGAHLGGSDFGILSEGYNGSASGGLKNQGPDFQNSMSFELSGFRGDLSGISDVNFQYGTTLDSEPCLRGNLMTVPEANYSAGSVLLLLPVVGLCLLKRRANLG